MSGSTGKADLAEALFVSHLQASQRVSADTVRAVVSATLQRHGCAGCAARVAYEFGEEPDCAVRRMRWARRTVRGAFDRSAA